MLLRLYIVALMFGGPGISEPQEGSKNVRGSVVSIIGPIPLAVVLAYDQTGNQGMLQATALQDGTYQFENLRSGRYIFKVEAAGFYTAEIRDVQIDDGGAEVLPAIRLDPAGYCDGPRPEYYRLLSAATGMVGVGGSVEDQRGRPIAGAIVKFAVKGKGVVAVQKTANDGTFSFRALQKTSERCWIRVERDGYFVEEVPDPNVLPGFESVGAPITLEACTPGHCQPYLKTVRVIPRCE